MIRDILLKVESDKPHDPALDYAVTVAEVERRTGLTFSSAIPKRQCKVADWE